MKKNNIVEEAKKEVEQNKKEANAMKNKTIIETTKTIVITVLLTIIAAFPAGVMYQKSVSSEVQQQINKLSAVQSESKK